jgi:hypothetical protein
MGRSNPRIQSLDDLQQVWNGLSSIYASKGVDLPQVARDLVKKRKESLDRWASIDSFNALSVEGCNEYSLVLCLKLTESARAHTHKFQRALGSGRERDQAARSFDKAAAALERFITSLDAAVWDDFASAASTPSRVLETAHNLAKQINPRDEEAQWPGYLAAPHPNTILRGLRFYSRLFRDLPHLWDPGMPYSESLGKYLLSAYTKRITGKFHDREVSALLGNATSTDGYDETAHRMWRSRNYRRIQQQCSSLVDLVVDVGPVIGKKA